MPLYQQVDRGPQRVHVDRSPDVLPHRQIQLGPGVTEGVQEPEPLLRVRQREPGAVGPADRGPCGLGRCGRLGRCRTARHGGAGDGDLFPVVHLRLP